MAYIKYYKNNSIEYKQYQRENRELTFLYLALWNANIIINKYY